MPKYLGFKVFSWPADAGGNMLARILRVGDRVFPVIPGVTNPGKDFGQTRADAMARKPYLSFLHQHTNSVDQNMKTIHNMSDLRTELTSIPRIKLEFAKAMTDLLAQHKINLSGDFLGQLTLATCDELEKSGMPIDQVSKWTN
jgi:hypothetical protein